MREHFRRATIGSLIGTVLGGIQPMFAGGGLNTEPMLTFKYMLVGGSVGFVVSNYLAFRQRLLQRIQQSQRSQAR